MHIPDGVILPVVVPAKTKSTSPSELSSRTLTKVSRLMLMGHSRKDLFEIKLEEIAQKNINS